MAISNQKQWTLNNTPEKAVLDFTKYQIMRGTKSSTLQTASGSLAQQELRGQLYHQKPVMGCAAKRKNIECPASDVQAAINEQRLKAFQQKAQQMRKHCRETRETTDVQKRSQKPAYDFTHNIIHRAVSQTVSDAFLSCELSSMDASVTFMEEPVKCRKAKGQQPSQSGGNLTFMEEPLTCHKAKRLEDQSTHCSTLSELSTIHMVSYREFTLQEDLSFGKSMDGPLHSSIRYPQFSTPTRGSNLSDEDLAFNDITFIVDSNNQECRSSSMDITVTLSKDSSVESSSVQFPLPTETEKREYTLNSDNTAFMDAPMCKKAVTYKMKSSRKAAVKKQLKSFGRQIKTIGTAHSNLETLAVL